MKKVEKTVSDILIEKGLISKEDLDAAAEDSKKEGIPLFLYLQDANLAAEEDILSILSDLIDIPFINLKDTVVEEQAIRAVPVRVAWHYEFMPVALDGNKLTIAVNAPLSVRGQDEIRLSLGYEIAQVLARREQILELLKTYYGLAADTVDKMVGRDRSHVAERAHAMAHEEIQDIEKMAEDASVIKLVNQIILEAFKKRATDIHIEPFRGKLLLRYRIDGKLQDQPVSENFSRFLPPILSRIKIMANLNIVERRVPQDGRAIVRIQDQVLDLRISFIPTAHGESVVIRILPSKRRYDLLKLGLSEEDLVEFESFMKKSSGIIFVTGPTGSGKTTTLYACLERMNTKDNKILTIEDPVEYELEGLIQIQVNPDVGLDFATGLRSMLRHDPDIMMVGEVRDKETAEIAIRVALTGHLVFSTLHTNDAATGITRLIDIGIPPYLISSSVHTFVAQRLVRVICSACKTEDTEAEIEIKDQIAKRLNMKPEDIKIFKGKGCDKCGNTGFFGRTAIYEILSVDNDIRRMITDRKTASEITRTAIEKGMKTLIVDGWKKVVDGMTTPEEVLDVCQEADVVSDVPSASTSLPEETEEEDAPKHDISFTAPRTRQKKVPLEQRVYKRYYRRLPLTFSLIKSSEGKIIKLNAKNLGQYGKGGHTRSVFTDDLGGRVPAGELKNIKALTIDISAGGLVLESQYLIPAGSVLEVHIDIPGFNEPFRCLAKIVRLEKDLPRCFCIAVCYLDMSKSDRLRIEEFCAQSESDIEEM